MRGSNGAILVLNSCSSSIKLSVFAERAGELALEVRERSSESEESMGSDPLSVVSALLEAGNVDTVYRDVYLERPRTLLSAEALKQAVTGDSKLVEAAGCPRPALSASSLAPGV